MHADAQTAAGLDHLTGDLDVGGGGRGIARGVVVQESTQLYSILKLWDKHDGFRIVGDVDWGVLDTVPSFGTVPSIFDPRSSWAVIPSEQFRGRCARRARSLPSPALVSRALTVACHGVQFSRFSREDRRLGPARASAHTQIPRSASSSAIRVLTRAISRSL